MKVTKEFNWKQFQVNYPECEIGNFSIQKFSIGRDDPYRMRFINEEGPSRDPGYGDFTKLVERIPGAGPEGEDKHRIWMSDSRAEILEHRPVLDQLEKTQHYSGKRVLINGLGLGMVALGALKFRGVDHIDVVEINNEVAALTMKAMLDSTKEGIDRITVHIGNAYDITWPPGTRWDVAWHDIWPQITDENVPGMNVLLAKYKSRVGWQGCWQRDGSMKMAMWLDKMRRGTLSPEDAMKAFLGFIG